MSECCTDMSRNAPMFGPVTKTAVPGASAVLKFLTEVRLDGAFASVTVVPHSTAEHLCVFGVSKSHDENQDMPSVLPCLDASLKFSDHLAVSVLLENFYARDPADIKALGAEGAGFHVMCNSPRFPLHVLVVADIAQMFLLTDDQYLVSFQAIPTGIKNFDLQVLDEPSYNVDWMAFVVQWKLPELKYPHISEFPVDDPESETEWRTLQAAGLIMFKYLSYTTKRGVFTTPLRENTVGSMQERTSRFAEVSSAKLAFNVEGRPRPCTKH